MIIVILCGGAGSRLWPISREMHPKPFILLPDGESLLQKAFHHAVALPGIREIVTVTKDDLYFKVMEEWATTGIDFKMSCLLEPVGRNTAPAICSAALYVNDRYGQDTPMLILSADHLIANREAFEVAVSRARELAASNRLVTLGIKPSSPSTGFGYIEAHGEEVISFVEKPDAARAQEFFKAENYYWNAGIFCFKAGIILDQMACYASELLAKAKECFSQSSCKRAGALTLNKKYFSMLPNISIDYALMEKSKVVSVVPCDIGWSDIGSWQALCALNDPDEAGNRVWGNANDVILTDSHNCDISGGHRLVTILGLRDLLIADTPDALLVAHKDREQEVKIIYNRLKTENRKEHLHHCTLYRPWGSFTLLETGPCFKIKRLVIKPGASISLQLHQHRSEHWVVVNGVAEVTCGEKVFAVNTNESAYIKAGQKHRLFNRELIDLVVIEVQSGDYLEEDDIVRFDDCYGRVDYGLISNDTKEGIT